MALNLITAIMLQDLSVFILIIEHVADLCAALRINRLNCDRGAPTGRLLRSSQS